MMRERERRRFEDYVLATEMSDERAARLRLEAAAPTSTPGTASEHASGSDSYSGGRGDASNRWAQLRHMFNNVVKAIERAKPPTNVELEAMARVAKDAAAHARADEAVELAMQDAIEQAISDALDEAATDVGAADVLSANGIGLDSELPPSEVYRRAMEAAQREFDRATRAYHRTERARLAKERDEMRAEVLKRKLGFEKMIKDTISASSTIKALSTSSTSRGGGGSKEKPATPSSTSKAASPPSEAKSPDSVIPHVGFLSSAYVC